MNNKNIFLQKIIKFVCFCIHDELILLTE